MVRRREGLLRYADFRHIARRHAVRAKRLREFSPAACRAGKFNATLFYIRHTFLRRLICRLYNEAHAHDFCHEFPHGFDIRAFTPRPHAAGARHLLMAQMSRAHARHASECLWWYAMPLDDFGFGVRCHYARRHIILRVSAALHNTDILFFSRRHFSFFFKTIILN